MTEITFTYTNWRGEKSVRKAVPLRLRFGTSEWHKSNPLRPTHADCQPRAVLNIALQSVTLPDDAYYCKTCKRREAAELTLALTK